MDTRTTDLLALNTATKYPSIMTYHVLGERGRLTQQRHMQPSANLIVTEKIDGTNTRVIFMPDGCYLIGSREHLLYARGDLIGNPAMGIVASFKDVAERLNDKVEREPSVALVVFLETYGGKTTAAAKHYTSDQSYGHRVFDVARVPLDVLKRPIAEISAWRESGGQPFLHEAELVDFARSKELEMTKRISAPPLPTDHADVLSWLETVIPATFAALDDKAKMGAEGVVVRSMDRKTISKIRFSDYRRTLKRK